jgi:hypothetical protein
MSAIFSAGSLNAFLVGSTESEVVKSKSSNLIVLLSISSVVIFPKDNSISLLLETLLKVNLPWGFTITEFSPTLNSALEVVPS